MPFLDTSGTGSGSGSGASIAEDMYFADTTARDAFSTANPARLYQGVACAVVNGASYDYYQYDLTATLWREANEIYQGQKGDTGEPGSEADVTDFIDDTTPSDSKTFSSNKIDALIQNEGFMDNGTVNNLDEDFASSNQIKQGKTLINGWTSNSNLPDVSTKKAILFDYGPCATNNVSFGLLTESDGAFYFYSVSGHPTGWIRTTIINDASVSDLTTFSSNHITSLIDSGDDHPDIPEPVRNYQLMGGDSGQTLWARSAQLFTTSSASEDIAIDATALFDAFSVVSSRYLTTLTKTIGNTLVFDVSQVQSEIEASGNDISLSDEGDDADGNMILGVTLEKPSGSDIKKTITIRTARPTLPDLPETTVVYGWTNNDDVTADDISFALNTEQTDTWKTRTENVLANALAATTFVAKRAGTEYKNFYVAHLTGFFDPEPYALNWGIGVDDSVKISNLSYDGKVGRTYMIATDGNPTANNQESISVELVQAS